MRIQPRTRPTLDCKGETMTEQHHKESCDMQHILKKFRNTGVLDHVAQHQGSYMNLPDAPTFHEAQNMIAEAKSVFESVPAHIRQDFDNDASKFVDFMQNNDNIDTIKAYGLDASHLTPKPQTPEPTPTPKKTPKSSENEEKTPSE